MKMYIYVIIPIVLIAVIGLTAACFSRGQIMDGDGMENSYKHIAQSDAMEMMKENDGHVVVDVRRLDEYAEGHIPGAICIPNETIGDTQPPELKDLDQIILIYCRSGRRSREAAQKLFNMGYTRIYEFGGIMTWKGEIVKEDMDFHMDPVAIPGLRINGEYHNIVFEGNSSAEAFLEKIKKEPLEIKMQDYGGFEKVGDLPYELPTNDERITTSPGDIILYQGNKLTIYYGENTWNLTRIGHIYSADEKELRELMESGEVTAEFFVEWTE